MQLRDYQQDAMARVQAVYRSGLRRALLVAPTGAGKSAMTRYMLGRTGKKTLILCHRAELQDMICEAMPVPFGVIGGSSGSVPREPVHVGMMQTVSRRLPDLPKYEWVISDEAHLAMCKTWRSILQHYDEAWHLGMSATPCRLDGQGLGAEYEQIVHGPTVRELTERGFLVPCRVFAPKIHGLPGKGATMAQDADALDHAAITGDVIEHWRRLAANKLTLAFCSSREHAEHVAEQFRSSGVPSAAVDSTTPDRAERIRDFRAGRIRVLTNVDLLTTGFDCPQIEAGIFLRRTKSLALYLQMVGRLLRLHPGKREAVLLDHVGNVFEHGMPDMDREWTLDGRERRAAAVSVTQCPHCYAAHRPAPRCPSCGHVYAGPGKPRRVQQREGVLEAVDGASLPQLGGEKLRAALKAARRMPTDPERRAALDAIRVAMGYKPNWTFVQMAMLQRFRGRRAA